MRSNRPTQEDSNKLNLKPQHIALIAYLTPFGLIAAYFLNAKKKNSYVNFHLKNMFGLLLFFYIGVILGKLGLDRIHEFIFYVGIIFWIFSFYYAYKQELKGLPFVDKYFTKWFKFLD